MVIRFSALGDVAMTVPVLLGLREKYPDLAITFLTRKHFAPVLEQVDGVSVIKADLKGEYAGISGLWKLSRYLRKGRFSAIADLHNVLRTKVLKLFLTGSGAEFMQIDKARKEKKQLTRNRNKVFKPLPTTFDRYREVFHQLGYPISNDELKLLPGKHVNDQILPEEVLKRGKRVGIAPMAAHEGKQYSLMKMEEVVRSLTENGEINVLLFGSPSESSILESWAQKYPHIYNLAGKISFEDELACISRLDVMVGMDSANGHLAAMYGVPVITIWGITHPYTGFAPFNQPAVNWLMPDREAFRAIPTSIYGNRYPPGYEEAINSLEPQEIVAKVNELL